MVGVEHRFAGGRRCGQPGGVPGLLWVRSRFREGLAPSPGAGGRLFLRGLRFLGRTSLCGTVSGLLCAAAPPLARTSTTWRSCFPVLEVKRACAVGRRGSTAGGTSFYSAVQASSFARIVCRRIIVVIIIIIH